MEWKNYYYFNGHDMNDISSGVTVIDKGKIILQNGCWLSKFSTVLNI